MQVFNLKNNPFYLLEVSPRDKRATILSKAEEKTFFLDGDSCDNAQTTLLNPSKRLYAELDWFLDADSKRIFEISQCIDNGKAISTEGLSPISRINALLFNLGIMQDIQSFDIGFVLVEIDEQFNDIDVNDAIDTINSCRKEAGMKDVSSAEFDEAINAKRNLIRQVFAEQLQPLSDDDYIEFFSVLAKKYVADSDCDNGIVISDALGQYEIRMQRSIEEQTEAIIKHIERTKDLTNEVGIKRNVTILIKKVNEWNPLVMPLQYQAFYSGLTHQNSEQVGIGIRGLALYLHNEKELTEISLKLVNAMQDVFAKVGDLAERFAEDAKQLKDIINTNEVVQELMSKMELLKSDADRVGFHTTTSEVDSLIAQVRHLDSIAKKSDADGELIEKIRISICIVAREAAIKLHNNYQKTALALKIAKALLLQFQDIAELKTRLSEDAQSLSQQAAMLNRIEASRKAQEESAKTKKIVGFVILGIFLFILLVAGLSQCDGSSSSSSNSSNNNNSYNGGSYYPSGGSSGSSGDSSSQNENNDKIVLTSSNFEDYFTITTSAEYEGNTLTISYSIKPKSTAYAADTSSSSSITVKLRGGVYAYSFSTTPTNSKTETITLYRSSGYKKSGTFTVYVSSGNEEIYWGTDISSASGTIYK